MTPVTSMRGKTGRDLRPRRFGPRDGARARRRRRDADLAGTMRRNGSRRRAAKASRSRICATRDGGGSRRSCSRRACRSPIRSRIGRSSSPRRAGVEMIGDIELFCRERAKIAPGSPFIAITGTNGKSTTTALIAHILRSAGRDVQMGGNIGTPILALEPPAPEPLPRDRMLVLPDRPCALPRADLGVLLNITPDHLDRHGTMENYAAIKERLVARAEYALINFADEPSRAIFQQALRRARSRSSRRHERFRRARTMAARCVPSSVSCAAAIGGRSTTSPASPPCAASTMPTMRWPRSSRRANSWRRGFATARPRRSPVSRSLYRGAWPNFGERASSRRRFAPFPACRIAWKRSAAPGAPCSSTIPRRRMPIPPRRRSPPFPAASSGSSAARRRRAASNPCVPSSAVSRRPI